MGALTLETKIQSSELVFQTRFDKRARYLGILGIIVVVTILIILINNGQLRIWALAAGGGGLIYLTSQIIKYGQFDMIRFSKTGVFLERRSTQIPKEVYLVEDLDTIDIHIRKKKIETEDQDKKTAQDEKKNKSSDEEVPEYRYWIDLILTKKNGVQISIDMGLFLAVHDDSVRNAAGDLQAYFKKTYNFDSYIHQD